MKDVTDDLRARAATYQSSIPASFTTTTSPYRAGREIPPEDERPFSHSEKEGPKNTFRHRSILELRSTPPDPSQTLLGERFLCRRGTLLLVGPSGVGKSSMSMQQDICWALGRPAFGVEPSGPLRILTIQAENDDGDLFEMADGVIGALELGSDDHEVIAKNTNYQSIVGSSGSRFIGELDKLLTSWPADIVRVDPLFAFFGGKIEDTESLGNFLRGGLNPVIHKHNCGLILAHHTPKTNNQDRSGWTHVDYSYAGAGSAELTNWARSLVVLEATHTPGTFKMIAAKRGARIGWRDPLGDREFIRYYRHSKRDGVICWEDGDGDEVERDAAAKRSKKRQVAVDPLPIFEELVTQSSRVEKASLLTSVNKRGVGQHAAEKGLKMLLDAVEPEFFEHREKRSGARPRLFIARYPQPSE
jgi:hypothetical protein